MPIFVPVDFDPFADQKEIEKITLTNEPQREIWLACIIGGDDANLAYNESVSLAIKGDLDFAAFKKAVDHLVLRHEALRATVSPNGETLIIYKNLPAALTLQDLSALEGSAKSEALQTFVRGEIDTPLDIYAGPLFKVYLHKLSEGDYYFTIIKHHVIGDGWSTGIILEDLARMYNAYSKGLEITLEPAAQLSEYASDQARYALTKEHQETEDYWLDLYRDNVPQLDMPVDHPRKSPRSYKGKRSDHPLSNELVNQLKTIGAKAGASLVTTLLAAFEVFLYEKTHQRDIVVGLPSSGQAASGLTNVVGHCVNLLPLKSYVDPHESFTAYLKKRKKEVLDAYDHQRFTFGELLKKLYIHRDASRIALVPVIFNIDMGMDNAVKFNGLDFKLISNPRDYENFEIFLNATKSKDGIILEWSYNTGLFDAETIETFNRDYHQILEKIIAEPAISIAALVGEAVETELHPAEDLYIPIDQTVNKLFEAAVKKYGNKTALRFKQASLTYAQLNEKADQLAAFLIEKGVKTGDIVGLSLERSMEMLVSLLAVLKAGAAYLPLDPEYPLERLEFMLADAGAAYLLTSGKYKNRCQTNAQEIVVDEVWSGLKNYKKKLPARVLDGNDGAYILYTSGSTGQPKGVKITQLSLVNLLISVQKTPGMSDADRLLALTTISFDIATAELLLPLISGAELIIADSEITKDGRLILSAIEDYKITVMQATPATWQMMLDMGWKKKLPIRAFSTGEALPKDLADNLLPLTNALWNLYGPTETTIWSTIKQILPGDKTINIGWPINNTRAYIMSEQGRPLSPGSIGELYIGGYGVAKGYVNRPELSADKFVTDTFTDNPGAMLYRTGDLCRVMDNGDIQCLGRIDQQVKIRGYRIELGEIESIIAKQTGVKQAVVIAREDVPRDKRLVAYVTLTEELYKAVDLQVQISTWKENMNKLLPAFMVPDDVVVLESFPLTPNAKIDRKALPKPKRKTTDASAKTVKVSANEQLIMDIWSEALDISDLKPTDDFFELGGHSILAVKVMVAIERETGKRLPLATLFNNSTIEKLAVQLSSFGKNEEWDSIVPIKASGTKPPLYLVHGSGLNLLMFKPTSEHFDEDQPLYGIQAIGLTKPVDMPDSIEGVAAYHIEELLRQNPEGPYAIAGYSYGGFIAFEMVKQLLQAGKKVMMLGMMDTNASAHAEPAGKTARLAKKVTRQFYKVPFFVSSFIKYPSEALAYQQLVIKRKMPRLFLVDKEENAEVDKYTDYERSIREKYSHLMHDFHLHPMDVEVALFRVEKRLYFLDDRKYLGWNHFALKGVKIYDIPGDHKTFLEPPNDARFAAIIQKALKDSKI